MDHLKRLPVVFEEFRAEFAACVLAQPPVQMARVANVEFVVVCTGDVDVVHGQFASRRWTILDEALRLTSFAQGIRLARRWSKTMSEPAGRQASRMAGGGGFEPPLTGSEPVVLPLDDPPVGPSSIISDER